MFEEVSLKSFLMSDDVSQKGLPSMLFDAFASVGFIARIADIDVFRAKIVKSVVSVILVVIFIVSLLRGDERLR